MNFFNGSGSLFLLAVAPFEWLYVLNVKALFIFSPSIVSVVFLFLASRLLLSGYPQICTCFWQTQKEVHTSFIQQYHVF